MNNWIAERYRLKILQNVKCCKFPVNLYWMEEIQVVLPKK